MSATVTEGRAFPSLFAVLPDKSEPVLDQFWRLVKHFVGDYKPTSLLTDLEISATTAFIKVFGDVKVTICLAEGRNANESGEEKDLFNMISAMPFVPPKEIERVFDNVFMTSIGKHSKKIDKFLVYFRDTYIGTGGQEGHIPPQLWSQFEAILDKEDSYCQSILLQEGLKDTLKTELARQQESIWATIGRFGLEEEVQAVRWREAVLQVNCQLYSSLLCFPQ